MIERGSTNMLGSIQWRLLGAALLLASPVLWAAQTCKYASIPATAPASRFTDNLNGTLTDTATGLQWKRCSEGQTWDAADKTCTGTATTYSWQQALQQAANLNAAGGFAGHGDWRLPNSKELQSIVEEACYDPAIDLAAFPGTPSFYFWSASPSASYSSYAWVVSFYNGYGGYGSKSGNFHARLVRGGQ